MYTLADSLVYMEVSRGSHYVIKVDQTAHQQLLRSTFSSADEITDSSLGGDATCWCTASDALSFTSTVAERGGVSRAVRGSRSPSPAQGASKIPHGVDPAVARQPPRTVYNCILVLIPIRRAVRLNQWPIIGFLLYSSVVGDCSQRMGG